MAKEEPRTNTFREGGLNGKVALSGERMSREQGEKRQTHGLEI